jgi:WXG100 family type VII secretion target
MAGNLQVDEASTAALINAFRTAADDQQAAHNAVTASQTALVGGWAGAASMKFNQGLGEWMQGLTKVHQALQMIDSSMVQFSKLTASTEDDASALAGKSVADASWT